LKQDVQFSGDEYLIIVTKMHSCTFNVLGLLVLSNILNNTILFLLFLYYNNIIDCGYGHFTLNIEGFLKLTHLHYWKNFGDASLPEKNELQLKY